MNKLPTTPFEQPNDILSETLSTAENIISFYETYLEVVTSENELLERENARLKSLLRTKPKTAAPPAHSWGNRWRPN